jgi:hypothetical protein
VEYLYEDAPPRIARRDPVPLEVQSAAPAPVVESVRAVIRGDVPLLESLKPELESLSEEALDTLIASLVFDRSLESDAAAKPFDAARKSDARRDESHSLEVDPLQKGILSPFQTQLLSLLTGGSSSPGSAVVTREDAAEALLQLNLSNFGEGPSSPLSALPAQLEAQENHLCRTEKTHTPVVAKAASQAQALATPLTDNHEEVPSLSSVTPRTPRPCVDFGLSSSLDTWETQVMYGKESVYADVPETPESRIKENGRRGWKKFREAA